ncbi:hypothetical protein HanPSC8_Chr10g0433061 [Helianthus annuus]|nr:hypothetical protein HanPSC8_Chr10g0433061 [Helianthus annuus]
MGFQVRWWLWDDGDLHCVEDVGAVVVVGDGDLHYDKVVGGW